MEDKLQYPIRITMTKDGKKTCRIARNSEERQALSEWHLKNVQAGASCLIEESVKNVRKRAVPKGLLA
jgi:hypothetical protein